MSLKEKDLFKGDIDKVERSIKTLQTFEPEEGYHLAFSGGKDSCCIKHLADMAGVKYDAHYSVTTIDPPDLIYFIKEHHPDVIWDRPGKPFLAELSTRGFPMRQSRWCCEFLKEKCGSGRRVITGVRRAESNQRAKRKQVENCYRDPTKKYINPIIGWTDGDVWEFIRSEELPYCKLYDEGWKRIGCLMCPMAGKHRQVEADKYPKFKQAFIKAFEKLYENRKKEGNTSVDRWSSGKEMFDWWLKEYREDKVHPDQIIMFEN